MAVGWGTHAAGAAGGAGLSISLGFPKAPPEIWGPSPPLHMGTRWSREAEGVQKERLEGGAQGRSSAMGKEGEEEGDLVLGSRGVRFEVMVLLGRERRDRAVL